MHSHNCGYGPDQRSCQDYKEYAFVVIACVGRSAASNAQSSSWVRKRTAQLLTITESMHLWPFHAYAGQ